MYFKNIFNFKNIVKLFYSIELDKFIGIKILSEIEISSNPNSQFQIYTDDSVTPNIFTTYSSSLYNRSADIFSYDFGDITEWIWPKFISNSSDWVAQLPVSLLNGSYNLMIGSNINNMYTYQAFTQIQNSRFVSFYKKIQVKMKIM